MQSDPHVMCRAADKLRLDDTIALCKEIDGLNATLTAAQSRIEKLERMVVWCVENEARLFMEHQSFDKPFLFKGQRPLQNTTFVIPSADSILAAVERAMGETK